MATWIEIRDEAKKAILEILQNGQSVSLSGRTLTMANLRELQDLEQYADQRAASETQQGAGETPARNHVIYAVPIG